MGCCRTVALSLSGMKHVPPISLSPPWLGQRSYPLVLVNDARSEQWASQDLAAKDMETWVPGRWSGRSSGSSADRKSVV